MTELILPKDPSIFLFVGKPKSGKSVAVRSILHDYLKAGVFKFGVVFCPTPSDTYDFLDPKYVIEEWGKDAKGKPRELTSLVLSYWNNIAKSGKEGKKGAPRPDRSGSARTIQKPPPSFIVLDDCLGQINFQLPEVHSWLSRFRHANTSIFFVAQYLAGVGTSTALREYANVAFIWSQSTKAALTHTHNAFGQDFDKNEWKKVLEEATKEKHRCLVVRRDIDVEKGRYMPWKVVPADKFTLGKGGAPTAPGGIVSSHGPGEVPPPGISFGDLVAMGSIDSDDDD